MATVQALITLARESGLYLAEIRKEYTERFPGKWIAVLGREVYGPVESLDDLRTLLASRSVDVTSAQFARLDQAFMLPMVL